ncbi:MAG: hypothetical protein K2M73_10570 [Lachnospiraceae bacterium]|nr:hypothetical protein [Lachnospiraceae bacterium]
MEIKSISTVESSSEIHAKLLVAKEYAKPTAVAVEVFKRPAFPNMIKTRKD